MGIYEMDIKVIERNGKKEIWLFEGDKMYEEIKGFGCGRGGVELCNDCDFYNVDCEGCGYSEADIEFYDR